MVGLGSPQSPSSQLRPTLPTPGPLWVASQSPPPQVYLAGRGAPPPQERRRLKKPSLAEFCPSEKEGGGGGGQLFWGGSPGPVRRTLPEPRPLPQRRGARPPLASRSSQAPSPYREAPPSCAGGSPDFPQPGQGLLEGAHGGKEGGGRGPQVSSPPGPAAGGGDRLGVRLRQWEKGERETPARARRPPASSPLLPPGVAPSLRPPPRPLCAPAERRGEERRGAGARRRRGQAALRGCLALEPSCLPAFLPCLPPPSSAGCLGIFRPALRPPSPLPSPPRGSAPSLSIGRAACRGLAEWRRGASLRAGAACLWLARRGWAGPGRRAPLWTAPAALGRQKTREQAKGSDMGSGSSGGSTTTTSSGGSSSSSGQARRRPG